MAQTGGGPRRLVGNRAALIVAVVVGLAAVAGVVVALIG